MAIIDAPRDVIEAARSAFDARHPGLEVLDLLEDSRDTNGVAGHYVLRFGDGRTTVLVAVQPVADALRVTVDVPGEIGLELLLEQLAPGLRLGRSAPAPAAFDDQRPGFVSVTGLRGSVPLWCTAWVRLAGPREP
jgi:hypothetical protein